MKTAETRTAKDALHATADKIRENAEWLLSVVRAREATRNINWSHVGDLAHVNELLEQAVKFLRGYEE